MDTVLDRRAFLSGSLVTAALVVSPAGRSPARGAVAADELGRLSASELAGRLRAKKMGARELVQAYLARISRHDDGPNGINAYITVDPEGARKEADRLDALAARGQ
jgi:hypothetical protein